jgi:6,7-dimethyl-8-ribityllumazine synthase
MKGAALPPRPRQLGQRTTFSLVTSQYNSDLVQGLVNGATNEIYSLAPGSIVTLYQVPGAFEIPVLAAEISKTKKPDVIIALGVIVQGETAHANLIAESVTHALQRVALDSSTPVIHAVLHVPNADIARERTADGEHNRGAEAARAAIAMVNAMQEVKTR